MQNPAAWLASALVSLVAAVAVGLFVDRYAEARTFFMEDGPVETVQALLLLAIAAVFALAFARSAGTRALVCLLAAYGCIFALTREIPRCGSAFAGGEMCLSAGWKRSIVLAASAAGLLALVLRPIDFRGALRPSRLLWTWPCLVVLGLLLGAEALEKLIYYSEIEEVLELFAYLHLGAFALSVLSETGRDEPA